MRDLVLAHDLRLPADLATQVTLIAGKRGSGKTSTAKRMVEQLHHAGVPFGVLDPVDVWWGLKAGRDGSSDGGLDGVYVFGGRHAEYPLAPTGGALMADLFVDYRISAVMELREWSGADRARFVTAFAHRLLERNTEPFTLVAEEAHDLMPQQAMGEEKGSLGAMLRLVKLGRSGGLGLIELTQRLAALNKTATTQADVLVIHRTTGPQDRKALNDWINEHHASEEERSAFLKAIPELKTGEAFVWAPDFPEDKPLGLQRHRIFACDTFNSHATPKVGEKRTEPKELKPADLARLSKAMSATVEKAKQDDPAELRRAIATLRKELAGAQKATAPTVLDVKRIEVPVLKDAQLKRVEQLIAKFDSVTSRFSGVTVEARDVFKPLYDAMQAVLSRPAPSAGNTVGAGRVRAGGARREARANGLTPSRAPSGHEPARTTDAAPKRYLQKVLDALASLEAIGYARATNLQVATWVKMSVRGGAYGGYVRELKAAGMVESDGTQKESHLWLTPAGRRAASAHDLATSDLHAMAHAVAKPYLHKVLDPLLEAYPTELDLAELALRAGMSIEGGAFGGYVRELRALGFVTSTKVTARAADALFLEERVR